MELRRQYIADSSSNENTTSEQPECGDANVVSQRDLLKDVHSSKLNSNSNGIAKPKVWKDKGYSRPKATQKLIGKSSSLIATSENLTDNRDDELDAIEEQLNDIWTDSGMNEQFLIGMTD